MGFKKFRNKKASNDALSKTSNSTTKNTACTIRSRCWIFEVYPESCTKDWKKIIKTYQVACYISPLHDKDTNEDGSYKKPHYHVMLYFSYKKGFNQVNEIVNQVKGVGCFVCYSKKMYARYLIHLDNPEKYQYNKNDVDQINTSDYFNIIQDTKTKGEIISEIMNYCDNNKIYSFAALMRYARDDRDDWFQLLINGRNTYLIKEFQKSASECPVALNFNYSKLKNEVTELQDQETLKLEQIKTE